MPQNQDFGFELARDLKQSNDKKANCNQAAIMFWVAADRESNGLSFRSDRCQPALNRGRIKRNASGRSSASVGCRECSKRAPATIPFNEAGENVRCVAMPSDRRNPASCLVGGKIAGNYGRPTRLDT